MGPKLKEGITRFGVYLLAVQVQVGVLVLSIFTGYGGVSRMAIPEP